MNEMTEHIKIGTFTLYLMISHPSEPFHALDSRQIVIKFVELFRSDSEKVNLSGYSNRSIVSTLVSYHKSLVFNTLSINTLKKL